jgi:hypothetical protein
VFPAMPCRREDSLHNAPIYSAKCFGVFCESLDLSLELKIQTFDQFDSLTLGHTALWDGWTDGRVRWLKC